jgi:hypothetical protein
LGGFGGGSPPPPPPPNQINWVYSKKQSLTTLLNNSQIYFFSKLTSFVGGNMENLRTPILALPI